VARRVRPRSVLPGFGLTMGYTVLYVSLLVLIPLAGLFFKSAALSWADIQALLTDRFVLASLRLTFWAATVGALVNAVFGFIVAWTLVKYPFPGSRFIDGLIDLPFALPTAVSGITLAVLFSEGGWYGRFLIPLGIEVSGAPLGVYVALTFIGLPFVVRTLQPAIADLDAEVEEAAASLGASRLQTFLRVIVPSLLPALLTGFTLALARGIGEYGSVIYISNNVPGEGQITAQLIMKQLEQNSYSKATALGALMLVASFLLLGVINGLQWWMGRRGKA